MPRIIALALTLVFLSACGTTQSARSGPIKPKPFVTPWEYYQKSRPAVWTEQDQAKVEKAAVHSTGEDTDSDKSHMVLIGVLVGVVVVGGTVAGILIAK